MYIIIIFVEHKCDEYVLISIDQLEGEFIRKKHIRHRAKRRPAHII